MGTRVDLSRVSVEFGERLAQCVMTEPGLVGGVMSRDL